MKTQSRKQREVAQRHELFLSIARKLLIDEGFHNLSMERIAEISEYSKGTVYQHFPCKEEILVQLCHSCTTQLLSMFEHAAGFDGTDRDRLLAVFYADALWFGMDTNAADMLQHLSMHGVRDKITEQSAQQQFELQSRVVGIVAEIIQSAINSGQLPIHENLKPMEIVFGLWSLGFGGQVLQMTEVPLESMGIPKPGETLIRMATVTLDGLGWKPLHDEAHFQQITAQFQNELFGEEFLQLARENNNNYQNNHTQ